MQMISQVSSLPPRIAAAHIYTVPCHVIHTTEGNLNLTLVCRIMQDVNGDSANMTVNQIWFSELLGLVMQIVVSTPHNAPPIMKGRN